jgi:hypothetical protein
MSSNIHQTSRSAGFLLTIRSVGGLPDVSLASAGERRDANHKLIASDTPIDPNEARKATKAENSQ